MDRTQALSKIRELVGRDLRPLADEFGVTVWTPTGKKNKGWAGHVIERYLGLPLNCSRAPNFGSWELKVVPLKATRCGLRVKETMAITMLDPVEVLQKDFEDSHLFNKLRKQIVVSRVFSSVAEESSVLQAAAEFDLGNEAVFSLVKEDYETIRETIRTHGFQALSGRQGRLVQPRTKGPGHGSTSRAFYARAHFVSHILGLTPLSELLL